MLVKVIARGEVEIPEDVEKLAMEWHNNKKRDVAAQIKEAVQLYVNWAEVKEGFEADLRDRSQLEEMRKLRDWAAQGDEISGQDRDHAAVIAELTRQPVSEVRELLARLDAEE